MIIRFLLIWPQYPLMIYIAKMIQTYLNSHHNKQENTQPKQEKKKNHDLGTSLFPDILSWKDQIRWVKVIKSLPLLVRYRYEPPLVPSSSALSELTPCVVG
jgi:hypothetical protein